MITKLTSAGGPFVELLVKRGRSVVVSKVWFGTHCVDSYWPPGHHHVTRHTVQGSGFLQLRHLRGEEGSR